MKQLYRYEHVLIGNGYDDDYLYPYTIQLMLREYPIIKETPCGYWIQIGYGYKLKFVAFKNNGNPTKKRWACLTKEEAMESFKARKRRQICLLEQQLSIAKTCLSVAEGVI